MKGILMKVPDRWVELVFNSDDCGVVKKILAGFYGGYLYGDSWQLNSGVEREEETDEYIDFYGYSGSVYRCYKSRWGMSGVMAMTFDNIQEAIKTDGTASVQLTERKFGSLNVDNNS